jgi:SAM-dependent methyltransferase
MLSTLKERLILCAGPYIYEGFKTLDANSDYKPDFCAVLPPLPRELRDGRWDEIYLIHGIEHFHVWEARELIKQIHEALAPGGLMVLEQPNIEIAAKVMLGLMESMTPHDPAGSGMNAIYGDPRYENPWMSHKWGWTPTTLKTLVAECGFPEDQIKVGKSLSRVIAIGRDFRLEATK